MIVIARVGVAVEPSFPRCAVLVFGCAADSLAHLRHVARVMLLQQIVDAARMFERGVDLGVAVRADS